MVYRWFQYWRLQKQIRWYISEVLEIRSDQARQGARTKQILSSFATIFSIICIKCAQAVFLTCVPISKFNRLINYDIHLFFECDQKWNLFNVCLCLLILYFLTRMYWHASDRKMTIPMLLHREVIYHQDSTYFVEPFITNRKHRLVRVDSIVRQYVLFYIYLFSQMVPFICKYFAFATKIT